MLQFNKKVIKNESVLSINICIYSDKLNISINIDMLLKKEHNI